MIKELVQSGKKVYFRFYRENTLHYVTDPSSDFPAGLEFPVPISDTGGATFLMEDRAMLFMRYIKPHLELVKEARAAK